MRKHASGWLYLALAAATACGGKPAAQTSTGGMAAGADTGSQVVSSGRDRLILAAAKVALPPPGVTPGDLPDPNSEGAHDIARFCTTCHSLPAPTMHSATDWPSIARRMWLRMEMLPAGLQVEVPTEEQRQAMLNYLLSHSLQVSGVNLPEGPGRTTFSKTCSRCHALPDPRQHSRADWPVVVQRMYQHMTQMKVAPPTQADVTQIILYLQQVSGRK
jgi:cytochrome c5